MLLIHECLCKFCKHNENMLCVLCLVVWKMVWCAFSHGWKNVCECIIYDLYILCLHTCFTVFAFMNYLYVHICNCMTWIELTGNYVHHVALCMRQDIRFAVTKKNSFHFVVLGLKHRSSISRAQPGLTGLDTNHGDLSQKCWALEIH